MNQPDQSRFPAAVYADTVLAINFRDAQRRFLDSFIEIQYAHTLMLARQGIISEATARNCVRGLNALDRTELASVPYDGQTEDLFFHVEDVLERLCGKSNAGSIHTARSRNDMAVTQYRM